MQILLATEPLWRGLHWKQTLWREAAGLCCCPGHWIQPLQV